jgi:hypothetical protein
MENEEHESMTSSLDFTSSSSTLDLSSFSNSIESSLEFTSSQSESTHKKIKNIPDNSNSDDEDDGKEPLYDESDEMDAPRLSFLSDIKPKSRNHNKSKKSTVSKKNKKSKRMRNNNEPIYDDDDDSNAPRSSFLSGIKPQKSNARVENTFVKKENPLPKSTKSKRYLYVSFSEKDTAKEKGAMWDKNKKFWYVKPDNLYAIELWGGPQKTQNDQQQSFEKRRYGFNTNVYICVPFDKKALAKAMGARWDAGRKSWYASGDGDHADLIDRFGFV